jgi:[protein-PII] uridylyltransferase
VNAPAASEPPAVADLKGRRQLLVEDRTLTGRAWSRAYAAVVDEWLTGLFAQATEGDDRNLALLAVGGYGSGEMAPGSDVDLLLVTGRRQPIGPIAEALWYPIWDQGVSLDHSVRTPREIATTSDEDLKVALGLLSARVVAGDQAFGEDVVAKVLDQCCPWWMPTFGPATTSTATWLSCSSPT